MTYGRRVDHTDRRYHPGLYAYAAKHYEKVLEMSEESGVRLSLFENRRDGRSNLKIQPRMTCMGKKRPTIFPWSMCSLARRRWPSLCIENGSLSNPDIEL